MSDESDKKKPEGKPAELKKIERVYFAPKKAGLSFFIKTRGEDGKYIQKTNAMGQPMFSGNRPVYMETQLEFTPLPTQLGKPANCEFVLKAEDPLYEDIFKELERMKLDRTSPVMDQKMFEEWQNPEAYKANDKLAKANDTIRSQKEEIAKLRAELAEAKKTGAK